MIGIGGLLGRIHRGASYPRSTLGLEAVMCQKEFRNMSTSLLNSSRLKRHPWKMISWNKKSLSSLPKSILKKITRKVNHVNDTRMEGCQIFIYAKISWFFRFIIFLMSTFFLTLNSQNQKFVNINLIKVNNFRI